MLAEFLGDGRLRGEPVTAGPEGDGLAFAAYGFERIARVVEDDGLLFVSLM